MTRLLAAAVVVAAFACSAAPASAQYAFGSFYGGYANVYAPQPYYNNYNTGYYNNYGYYNNNYGYSNYGYSNNYGYANRGYSNYGSRYSNRNYNRPTTYGSFNTNGAPITLPDGNTVSGFKNVTILPPGYTVQGGF